MPMIRKLVGTGNAKAVTIPASWIRCWEKENKQKLEEVEIEINGEIIIRPHKEKK